jgi:hypothetical protein
MSGAPFKKLPASPCVGSPSVPVADRGGEEVNVDFSDFWAEVAPTLFIDARRVEFTLCVE